MVAERDALLEEWDSGETEFEWNDRDPAEVLRWGIESFGKGLALCTSFQSEGMVVLDMAMKIDPAVRVVTVDTGRMHPETYDLIDRVRETYGCVIEVLNPDAAQLEPFVQGEGINPFYRSLSLRQRCCEIRKVDPLKRALQGLDAWVTGLRREQWSTRENLRQIQIDHDHGGLIKISPLAGWTGEDVWEYVRSNRVPYSDLYDRGYTSIGCAPCTRAIAPGENDRAGRWWWETDAPKECGMHPPAGPRGV